MFEEDVLWENFDDAVQGILRYFVENQRDMRVIYFDGWRGFGASTVLRAVADALISRRASPELHLDEVIHIDCSAWKSRRAMQRAIAVELKLDASVMAVFDKQDEEDDFNGVDEGSRGEIPSFAKIIYRAHGDRRFMVIFHNGSGDDIELSSFGLPPFLGYFMLWTFRRRFRARELYSEMPSKVKNTHIFAYESAYDIAGEGIFLEVLEREAAAIAANYPCMREMKSENIVRCCLYELFLHLCFPKNTEYDWAARASSYWICDGIIQGDRAWEISNALRQEIKWDLHPDLLHDVRRRFVTLKFWSKNWSSHFLTFKDGQEQYPWIAITSSDPQIQDMQATNAEVSSYFLAPPATPNAQLVLADGLFEQSTNLRVLHLSRCTFSFASPQFICCQNLRFLGVDHCKDNRTGEGEDQRKWGFLHSLWVIDLFYTDWSEILSGEKMDLMTNLREINIEGVRCWQYTRQLQGRVPDLHKLRIVKPTCGPETSIDTSNSFLNKTKLEILDLSGNSEMDVLPNSLSMASSLQVLVLDGCNGLENVVPDGLPHLLKSFSIDGYGPASHWTPAIELPPNNFRPSTVAKNDAKINKISLEGCKQLENVFLRGLPNLVELDLCGTAIKILDFKTMAVEVPGLKRLFLLGCECLRAIIWDKSGSQDQQPELELLCIDTRARIVCPRPSFHMNKSFRLQVHAIVADARLARSLYFPLWGYRMKNSLEDVYFNIHVTSSPVYSSGVVQLDGTCKEKIGPGDQVSPQQLVPTNQYNDVLNTVGNAPMQAFPQPPTTNLVRHIEISEGGYSVDTEMVAHSPSSNLANLLKFCAESLHVHDALISDSMHVDRCYCLRQCRVERCPKLETVFHPHAEKFKELETICVSDLLMARCIWGKGSRDSHISFKNLQLLHLCSCPRLQFVLPVWVTSFPSLETLHIIHCGDLRHVFLLDGSYPEEIADHGVAFPKLTTIHLHDLPMLQQICEVKMVASALETIKIRGCWGLRRLPAVAACARYVKKPVVEIEKDVWDALEWDGLEAGHHHCLFEAPIHSRYYKKKLPRGSVLR